MNPSSEELEVSRSGARTVVRSPGVVTAEDRAASATIDRALWSLLLMLLAPVAAPFWSIPVLRRALRFDYGQEVRCMIAVILAASSLVFSLMFLVLWATLRPTPLALVSGWAGLRHLPAVAVGFQHTKRDPFGFSLSSWKSPGSSGAEQSNSKSPSAPGQGR